MMNEREDFGEKFFKNGWKWVSPKLKIMIEVVLREMLKHDPEFKGFDCDILDKETEFGYAGEVLDSGRIILDSKMLLKYDRDVALALIAHEFAHAFLRHQQKQDAGLNEEHEADHYAKKWGFNIEKFRHVCGDATLE